MKYDHDCPRCQRYKDDAQELRNILIRRDGEADELKSIIRVLRKELHLKEDRLMDTVTPCPWDTWTR